MNDMLEKPKSLDQASDAESEKRAQLVMEAFELHHSNLYAYVLRLTRNPADTDDILQDLWCLALRKRMVLRLPILMRRAYFLFVDRYRASKRRPEVFVDEVPEIAQPLSRQMTFSAEGEEKLKQEFWSNFPNIRLSDEQKNAVWMTARYGFTLAQVSQLMGVPDSTLADWLSLARRRLLEEMNNQENL